MLDWFAVLLHLASHLELWDLHYTLTHNFKWEKTTRIWLIGNLRLSNLQILMFKWLIKRIKATTVALSGLRWIGVGLAATTEEVDDTAPRKDPTAPEEDNE